jgi:hypothetical protein
MIVKEILIGPKRLASVILSKAKSLPRACRGDPLQASATSGFARSFHHRYLGPNSLRQPNQIFLRKANNAQPRRVAP